MPNLLSLPPEIRLKIYTLSISSQPHFISVDEGATSREPPRSTTAKALQEIDPQLADEMFPLYWSNNVFSAYQLTGMGHYVDTDRVFHRWLREIVGGSAGYVRYLRFKGIRAAGAQAIQDHDCLMTVGVDLKERKIEMLSRWGELSSCEHARPLRSFLEDLLDRVPFVEGKVCPSLEFLWTLFDTWYNYHPLFQCTSVRHWDEFERRVAALSGE